MRELTEGLLSNVGVGLEADMKSWCDEMYIENYSIVDGKINVKGSVSLLRDIEFLPYPFGVVKGSFFLVSKNLKTLKNCPKEVNLDFIISGSKGLESLAGSPERVGCDYACSSCDDLKSLEGITKHIGGALKLSNCKNIKSLKGAPEEVGGGFSCNGTSIISLEGAPKKVGGVLDCGYCFFLKSLKGAPKKINSNVYLTNCMRLKSLDGLPEEILGTLDCFGCENLKEWSTVKRVKIVAVLTNCFKMDFDTIPNNIRIKRNN